MLQAATNPNSSSSSLSLSILYALFSMLHLLVIPHISRNTEHRALNIERSALTRVEEKDEDTENTDN